MVKTQITVRHVDEDVFKEFKANTVKKGMKLGQSLTLAMSEWLDEEKEIQKFSLLDLKPFKWGKGTEKTSKEIDKILYGA